VRVDPAADPDREAQPGALVGSALEAPGEETFERGGGRAEEGPNRRGAVDLGADDERLVAPVRVRGVQRRLVARDARDDRITPAVTMPAPSKRAENPPRDGSRGSGSTGVSDLRRRAGRRVVLEAGEVAGEDDLREEVRLVLRDGAAGGAVP
jgi:hypothetical protein